MSEMNTRYWHHFKNKPLGEHTDCISEKYMAKITSDAYVILCFIFGMLPLGDLHLVSPFLALHSTTPFLKFTCLLTDIILLICQILVTHPLVCFHIRRASILVFVAVISNKVSYFLLSLANNWKYALGQVWQIILECRMKSSSGLGFASFSASRREGGHEMKNFKLLLPLKEEILPSFHPIALFLSLYFLWCYHKCFWKEPAWVTPTKAAMLAERPRATFGSSICSCQLSVDTLA